MTYRDAVAWALAKGLITPPSEPPPCKERIYPPKERTVGQQKCADRWTPEKRAEHGRKLRRMWDDDARERHRQRQAESLTKARAELRRLRGQSP